jgi:hypothetical protein
MPRRKEGELDASKPVPVDEDTAESKEPPVLVLLGAVVHLQPQCMWSLFDRNILKFGMKVQECGGDVQVRRPVIHWQVVHVFSGMLREVDDAYCMQGHSFISCMAFGNRTQMGKPHAGWRIDSQMHVPVRKFLRLFHSLHKRQAFHSDELIMSNNFRFQSCGLLRISALGFSGGGLSADITEPQPSLLWELDVLEVVVHDGVVSANGRQTAGILSLFLEVLHAHLVHVLVAEVHGNMDCAVRHLISDLLKEG